MSKINPHISGAVRQFALWLANRTVGHPLLDSIDYGCIFHEPSALETTFAVFCNCLELDEHGLVVNFKEAENRAAQYVRSYCDPEYKLENEFEDWEVELHPVSDQFSK